MERRSQRAEEAPRRESGRRESPLASRMRAEGETGKTGGGAACEAGQRRCAARGVQRGSGAKRERQGWPVATSDAGRPTMAPPPPPPSSSRSAVRMSEDGETRTLTDVGCCAVMRAGRPRAEARGRHRTHVGARAARSARGALYWYLAFAWRGARARAWSEISHT